MQNLMKAALIYKREVANIQSIYQFYNNLLQPQP